MDIEKLKKFRITADSGNINAILINAILDLAQEVMELQTEVKKLNARIDKIHSKNHKVKKNKEDFRLLQNENW